MARRSSLPGADELFRSTSPAIPAGGTMPRGPLPEGQDELHLGLPPAPATAPAGVPSAAQSGPAHEVSEPAAKAPARRTGGGVRRVSRARQAVGAGHQPSGRERHEEKITVYVSPQELLDLERARWVLRAEHGLASDRGRIVREAMAVVLADLEAKGADSILVTRLQHGE